MHLRMRGNENKWGLLNIIKFAMFTTISPFYGTLIAITWSPITKYLITIKWSQIIWKQKQFITKSFQYNSIWYLCQSIKSAVHYKMFAISCLKKVMSKQNISSPLQFFTITRQCNTRQIIIQAKWQKINDNKYKF